MDRQKVMHGVRRLVVKVGSGVLTSEQGKIDRAVFDAIAEQCARALGPKRSLVLVSSGAIALGVEQLKLAARPKRMDALQACAAAGQGHLIRVWSEAFAPSGRVVAQVLLTHADLADRKRFLNARRCLAELTSCDAIPIINENDTVSVEEIAFGDNDALSSQVANLVGADLLVMLSVAPGLLDRDRRVGEVLPQEPGVERLIWEDKSPRGTGGMATKVKAARAAASRGIAAVIASGKMPNALDRILAGEDVGTIFFPVEDRLASRAHWIAHTLRAKGTVVVDQGAVAALVQRHRSLLPSGVTAVRGTFQQGDAVDLAGPEGAVFARGLATYSASELESIRGRRATEILGILGYHLGDEVVHKDDLVILPEAREAARR